MPNSKKKRWAEHRPVKLLFLALLAASFMGAAYTLQQAHAGNGLVVSNTCNHDNAALATTNSCVLTVANVGDIVVVISGYGDGTDASITSVGLASATAGAVTLTNRIFINDGTVQGGSKCSATNCHAAAIWSGLAGASGAVTVTITYTAPACAASGCYGTMEAFDLTGNAAGQEAPFAVSSGSQSGQAFLSSVITGTPNTIPAGGLAFAAYGGTDAPNIAAGTGFTAVTGTEVVQYSTSNPASPTSYPFVHSVATTGISYAIVGATFGSSAVVTTTVNTGCIGCFTANSTKTYFSSSMPRLYVFEQSQNTAGSAAQIDNFTMKVAAVHINAASGTLYVVTYMPATPTSPPSASNLYTLVPGQTGTYPVVVQNGTTDFFIHANPQTNICAGCYYAVGIMGTTTASRGSGAAGSGVQFYETSGTGLTQYNFDMNALTPAATFFSSTIQTPRFFMAVHDTFTVALQTTTTTVTGAAGTVLVTSTITSTSLDVTLAVNNTTSDMVLLLVILGPAMLLMVPIAVYTRSPQGAGIGFVAGLMIGTGLGVQAQLVPPAFLGVSVIVGVFMIVGLVRAGGGGP